MSSDIKQLRSQLKPSGKKGDNDFRDLKMPYGGSTMFEHGGPDSDERSPLRERSHLISNHVSESLGRERNGERDVSSSKGLKSNNKFVKSWKNID